MTGEEVKTDARAIEMEIASLIPAEAVVDIVQKPEGTLLSCDETQHNRNGSTTVTLTPSSNAERIVKDLETRLEDDDRFESRNWIDPTGAYNVQHRVGFGLLHVAGGCLSGRHVLTTAPPTPPRPSINYARR